jgi:ribonuclease HI
MSGGRVLDLFSGDISKLSAGEKRLLEVGSADDDRKGYDDDHWKSKDDAMFRSPDAKDRNVIMITDNDLKNSRFNKKLKRSDYKGNYESFKNDALGIDESRIVRVYCDGSCYNNGKSNAVAGIGITFPAKNGPNVSIPYMGALVDVSFDNGQIVRELTDRGLVTNQRAELTAVYLAIQLSKMSPGYVAKESVICIYTDSEYSIKTFTDFCYSWEQNNWRKVDHSRPKNLDIILPVWELMRDNRVEFSFTPSHTGRTDVRSLNNDAADKLAKKASMAQLPDKPKKTKK